MVLLLQAGVGDDETAVVEHQVRDQSVAELLHLGAELRRLAGELGQGGLQAVADLNLLALQGPDKLVLVVAGHAQGVSGRDHPDDQAQYPGRVGAAVDQVADEHRLARAGRDRVDRMALVIGPERVTELGQQRFELGAAAVDVADDVERPVLMPEVVEQLLPHDDGIRDLLLGPQHVHLAKTLLAQVPQRPAQLIVLAFHDLGTEIPVGAGRGAVLADALGQVQDDGHRQHVVRTGELDEPAPGLALHVRGVDDRQMTAVEPLPGDEMQDVEGRRGGGLVVLVTGDESPAVVARQHLERREVVSGEGGFARTAHPDQADQRQLRNGQLAHATLRKTAIWVGGPTSESSGPMDS